MIDSWSDAIESPEEEVREPSKGVPVIVSGFTGAGKSTVTKLVRDISEEAGYDSNWFMESRSRVTDRPLRAGEIQGRDGLFVDTVEFERMRDSGELIHSYSRYGNNYGFSWRILDEELDIGNPYLIGGQIDTSMELRERIRDVFGSEVEPMILFINRGPDSIIESIRKRVAATPDEADVRIRHILDHWQEVPAELTRLNGSARVIWNDGDPKQIARDVFEMMRDRFGDIVKFTG